MKHIIKLLFALSLLISCTETNRKAEITNAVCITENSPVYEDPVATSQIVANLQLGEQVQVIHRMKTKKKTGTSLAEIHLSDGTTVWTPAENLVENALPAAIVSDAPVFELPEQGNPTGKQFNLSEFSVITEQNDTWVKITGPGKEKIGWIMKEHISAQPGDVNIAIMAHSDLLDKNGIIIRDKLADFMKRIPDANARLAKGLQELMDREVADAIEQSIIEYEQHYYNEDIQIED